MQKQKNIKPLNRPKWRKMTENNKTIKRSFYATETAIEHKFKLDSITIGHYNLVCMLTNL
jgi:hypothetical protein